MRRISYFENMRGHLNQVSREELEGFKGYDTARKYNLDYPILHDLLFANAGKVAEIYTSAHIGKFVYATATTGSVEAISQMFLHGYKIIDVIEMEKWCTNSYSLTVCKYGLLMGRK